MVDDSVHHREIREEGDDLHLALAFGADQGVKEAVDQLNDLILNYPNGNKIPEAYLKKGICLEELGQKEEALSVYKLLVSKFPLEEETKIAQQKIKELTTKK